MPRPPALLRPAQQVLRVAAIPATEIPAARTQVEAIRAPRLRPAETAALRAKATRRRRTASKAPAPTSSSSPNPAAAEAEVAAGGTNRNLRRAVRSFVGKSSGGARRATQRMAAERSATASLGRILSTAGTAGIQETVRRLGFAQLATLPVQDIYAALVDVICEPGGELDESFAREAYIKALAEISEAQADLERPSPETTVSFLASFITNAIQNRLLNAIGNKVVAIPRDVAAVQNLEQQINDFIRGNVNDAMTEAGKDFPVDVIVSTIDDIYERSVVLLEGSDQEGPDVGTGDDLEVEAHEEIA